MPFKANRPVEGTSPKDKLASEVTVEPAPLDIEAIVSEQADPPF